MRSLNCSFKRKDFPLPNKLALSIRKLTAQGLVCYTASSIFLTPLIKDHKHFYHLKISTFEIKYFKWLIQQGKRKKNLLLFELETLKPKLTNSSVSWATHTRHRRNISKPMRKQWNDWKTYQALTVMEQRESALIYIFFSPRDLTYWCSFRK